MRRARRLLCVLPCALLAAAAVAPGLVPGVGLEGVAEASVSIAIPFEALVRESTAVALGTPVSESSVWEGGRIITYTEVRVDALVAGNATPQGRTLWVRTMGGAVGHIGQSVEGEPSFVGREPCLLFLRPYVGPDGAVVAAMYTVTARAQGQFPVVQEASEQRVHKSSGVGATMASKASPGAVLAADVLHGLRVADATQAVVSAWGRAHAP